MASLLTDEFVARQRTPDRSRGPEGAARRLASAQDRALQGDGRSRARLPARPGIARIVEEALGAGWALAVASTSAEESVRAVLEQAVGDRQRGRFAVFAGDIVPAKKPDPAIYTLALERLSLEPADALVIEDSRNGLLAAVGAGLRCVVTVSATPTEEDMSEAVLVRHEPRRSGRARGGPCRSRRRASQGSSSRSPISMRAEPNPYATRRLYERERADAARRWWCG